MKVRNPSIFFFLTFPFFISFYKSSRFKKLLLFKASIPAENECPKNANELIKVELPPWKI